MAEKNFVVSVADAYVFDPKTNDLLFVSKANINTGLEITMSSTDVRAGFGNKLQFRYYHTRELSMTIEAATFEKNFLASNVGSTIATQADKIFAVDEIITIKSNSATLKHTPATGVSVFLTKQDGTHVKVTPSGSTINFTAPDDTKLKATYQYATTATQVITVDSGTSPSILKVILKIPQFDQNGENADIEIEVPNFQVSGEYSLSLTADGVSTSAMTGSALSSITSDFDKEIETYATVKITPLDTSSIVYQSITAQVNGANYVEAPNGQVTTYQIRTIGIIGGISGNREIPASELTFTATGDSDITVAATGVITVASGAAKDDTSNIKVETSSGLEAHVIVKVV